MTEKQAIKLAIEYINEGVQKFVFDANLHAQGQINHHTTRCAKKYKKAMEAIKILEAIAAQPPLF